MGYELLTLSSLKLAACESDDSNTWISSTFSSPSGLGAVNSSASYKDVKVKFQFRAIK